MTAHASPLSPSRSSSSRTSTGVRDRFGEDPGGLPVRPGRQRPPGDAVETAGNGLASAASR